MIVVDSSALIAVLFEEPEKQAFQDIIDGDERCVLSAVNAAHETACVLRGRLGVVAVAEFWQWLADNEVEVVPFDEVQVRAAAAAFDRYGKSIDPKARLNLADCAAYALAATMNAPLLFKGDDFAATDVRACL
jgi:ribonuclease VapC